MATTTPATGRERFIPIAAEIFARRGFGLVALDEIIAAAGVTKTTFYKHFESRDALIVAVLAHQHELEMAMLRAAMNKLGGDDPRAQILAIFDVLDQWFADTDFRGCMFLNAATEFPQETDPIHQAAVAHGAGLHALVREKCVEAGATAEMASDVAAQITLLISGAIIARQAARNVHAGRVARRTAQLILNQVMVLERTGVAAGTGEGR